MITGILLNTILIIGKKHKNTFGVQTFQCAGTFAVYINIINRNVKVEYSCMFQYFLLFFLSDNSF